MDVAQIFPDFQQAQNQRGKLQFMDWWIWYLSSPDTSTAEQTPEQSPQGRSSGRLTSSETATNKWPHVPSANVALLVLRKVPNYRVWTLVRALPLNTAHLAKICCLQFQKRGTVNNSHLICFREFNENLFNLCKRIIIFLFFPSYNTLPLKYPFVFGDTAWAPLWSNWKICSLYSCSPQSTLCNQNCMVFQHSFGPPAASDTTITSPLKGLRSLLKLIYTLARRRSGSLGCFTITALHPQSPTPQMDVWHLGSALGAMTSWH